MKLSTTSRYGVRAIVDIVLNQEFGPVSIHSISKRQNISIKYLESILRPLKINGILDSTRGVNGGYHFSKDPNKVTPGDIVRILDGTFDLVYCLSTEEVKQCERSNKCSTRNLWYKLKLAIESVLDSISIQELANQQANLNKGANSV
jgi:Rrf2 family cysteine metabolism transcriptional repressor